MIESNKLQIAAIFELRVISHPEQNLMDFEQGENELMHSSIFYLFRIPTRQVLKYRHKASENFFNLTPGLITLALNNTS